jgi:hypothetical protein
MEPRHIQAAAVSPLIHHHRVKIMGHSNFRKALSVGEVVVKSFVEHGVQRAFCVPGESYLAILEAIREQGDAFDLVVCRHEGGAAYMAEASGRLTGKPGICLVTRGPGACNAAIGVHTAQHEGTPMILLVGDVSRGTKGRFAFQDVDLHRLYGGMAKLGGIARMVTTPLLGVLADHWGRRKTMVCGCVLTTLSVFPGLIWLQASPVFFTLLTVELIVNVLAQIVNAAMPTALAELFPTEVRSQGLSVCFNGAVTLFGGTTPFIVTWFVSQTGNQLVPGYYATAGMLFSLACAFMIARKPAHSLQVAGVHPTSS